MLWAFCAFCWSPFHLLYFVVWRRVFYSSFYDHDDNFIASTQHHSRRHHQRIEHVSVVFLSAFEGPVNVQQISFRPDVPINAKCSGFPNWGKQWLTIELEHGICDGSVTLPTTYTNTIGGNRPEKSISGQFHEALCEIPQSGLWRVLFPLGMCSREPRTNKSWPIVS